MKLSKRHQPESKDIVSRGMSSVFMFTIGGTILIICSSFLIRIISNLGNEWGVSSFWIGLVFISITTTLPELLVGWWNHKKQETLLTIEKLLGSLITNSTLVVGLLAIIQPFEVSDSLSKGISGLFLVLILGLFWIFTKSKKKLERWEGVVLIGVYLMFLGLQMLFVR